MSLRLRTLGSELWSPNLLRIDGEREPAPRDAVDRMLPLVLPVDVDLDREFAFSLDRLLAGRAAELPRR